MKQLSTKFLEILDHRYIGILACALILLGLVSFRALMSIGMITLGVRAVLSLHPKENIQNLLQNKALLALLGIFGLYLISGLWSENFDFWLDRMRMKLPFLALPFGFAALQNLKFKDYQYLLYAFFVIIAALCLWLLGVYFNDFENLNEIYRKGQVLPTPVNHIRFSLMAVYAFALGLYFVEKSFFVRFHQEKIIVLILTLFLFVFIHILAVRSGLLALYLVLGYQFVHYIIRSKKYLIGMGIAVFSILSIIAAFYFIPTLQNKIGYTQYSLNRIKEHSKLESLSDSKRIATIEAAIVEGQKTWLIGIGVGDVQDVTTVYLQKNYPSIANLGILPHNQYLFVWLGIGTIGLILFLIFSLYPMFYQKAYLDSQFMSLNIIILSSFLVEHTIEVQIGSAFYTLFVFIGINMASKREECNTL
ncbi:MAG: O-antigen ligase family protein [Chitinophagales bacterium]